MRVDVVIVVVFGFVFIGGEPSSDDWDEGTVHADLARKKG
jgi:hypothetical protein